MSLAIIRPSAPIMSMAGMCHEPVEYTDETGLRRFRPCGRKTTGRTVDLTKLGRGDVSRCYCVEHGGTALAVQEIERDWLYVAPVSVGGYDAVVDAGADCLRTPDAYVVLRQEHGRWLAYLGLGTMQRQLMLRTQPVLRNGRPYMRHGKPRGMAAVDTHEEALTVALVLWREHVSTSMRRIRDARGGVLDWGVPVAPLSEPVVIDASGRNAWDVAIMQPRHADSGYAFVSGLRPSGESL